MDGSAVDSDFMPRASRYHFYEHKYKSYLRRQYRDRILPFRRRRVSI